jgi:ATP-dependent Lon protease
LQDDLLAVPAWFRLGEEKGWQKAVTILTKQAEILSYPKSLHAIAEDCDFSELEQAFGEDMRDQLRTELTRIKKNANHEVPDDQCQRTQLWIYGPPGVGKTRFAEQLGKKTGLPVIKISNKGKSVDEIFSAPERRSRWEDPISGDGHLGVLLYAMIRSGCKNPILVIDESDDMFADEKNVSVLKKYTDKDYRQLEGPGGTTMPFSRCTLIVIGNKLPVDTALADRYTRIHITYLPRAYKEKIAVTALEASIKGISRRDEPAASWIKAIATDLLAFIVDENEKCRIPGVRAMNDVIGMVVEQLEVRWVNDERGDSSEAKERIGDSLKPMIQKRFNRQRGEPSVEKPETLPLSAKDTDPPAEDRVKQMTLDQFGFRPGPTPSAS